MNACGFLCLSEEQRDNRKHRDDWYIQTSDVKAELIAPCNMINTYKLNRI